MYIHTCIAKTDSKGLADKKLQMIFYVFAELPTPEFSHV